MACCCSVTCFGQLKLLCNAKSCKLHRILAYDDANVASSIPLRLKQVPTTKSRSRRGDDEEDDDDFLDARFESLSAAREAGTFRALISGNTELQVCTSLPWLLTGWQAS